MAQKAYYDSLPNAAYKDAFIKALVNQSIGAFGYDLLGLNNNLDSANGLIQAELLFGDYLSTHTYGWTEFEIDATTQQLLVTTFGVPYYDVAAAAGNPAAIAGLTPQIVSQFRVTPVSTAPVPVPAAAWLFCSALLGLFGTARRRA